MKRTLTNKSFFRIIILLVFIIFIGWSSIIAVKSVSTEVRAATSYKLTYRSIPITSADTLWSIAEANYTEECGSMTEYIDDIMRCNALTSEDINAGTSIIVPVYMPEKSS